MLNPDIAAILEELADLLEIDGENEFRVRAYRRAVRTIESQGESLAERVNGGEDLKSISGIGDAMAQKITEIVSTGKLEKLEKLREKIPAGVVQMLRISGLGPKKVRALYKELKLTSLEDLKGAAEDGRIAELPGMGAKTQAQILKGIEQIDATGNRFLRADVEPYAEALTEHLQACDEDADLSLAGSYRRRRDTVGDLDILAVSNAADALMQEFTTFDGVKEILAKGSKKSSVVLRNGLQVDLRVVAAESKGAALHYFSGSQAHNIVVRRLAQEKGLKVNEYGVFDGDETVAGRDEDDVFGAVGLPFIPPELREDRGEFDAARRDALPELVELADIRGDIHMHSTASDGRHSIRDMAEAARDRGLKYIAITDHSKRLTVANGLDENRLRAQGEEIDALNDELKGITVLKGVETDILADGGLDIDDDVLASLDVVIGSIHHKFGLTRDEQTDRVIRAMESPHLMILGHPTGRLLLSREPYAIDMERIIECARERGTILEVNANPQRLDLNEVHVRMAIEAGVTICVNTDAHRTEQLDLLRHGVMQARRGWAERSNVLNTRGLGALRKALGAIRR